ncbi:hypothetical protein K4G86_23580, partial [Mycobacterium tuberculosis]|nr:hypothetical protein [Mycobacterium tuberculosis]
LKPAVTDLDADRRDRHHAGGIGYLAVVYGYQRFDNHIMIATIVALIATIQLIQFLGDRLVNRLRHTQGNLV